MTAYLLIVAGLALLVMGGGWLVGGATQIAQRLGISPVVIGVTLIGFGTSTPELVTSLQAALSGAPGIAVGNVVGSNIANVLLILGLAAVIAPVTIDRSSFRREGWALALSALAGTAAIVDGKLTPVTGVLFLVGLSAYVALALRTGRQTEHFSERDASSKPLAERQVRSIKSLGFVAVGMAATIIGARLLVSGSVSVAQSLGVADTLIGLTVVAVGTSLPELVASVTAARRGQSEIAFGNVVGSNIFNILFILGATATIKSIPVPASIASLDIWIMLAVTATAVGMAVTGWTISRREGAALLLAYILYTLWLVLRAT